MTSTDQLDPFTAVVGDDRHRIFQELAAEAAVQRIVMPGGPPVWLVTGYAETVCARLLTNPDRLARPRVEPALMAVLP